jgi:photosystem II stability/assembly factor-like uncharacterized protein
MNLLSKNKMNSGIKKIFKCEKHPKYAVFCTQQTSDNLLINRRKSIGSLVTKSISGLCLQPVISSLSKANYVVSADWEKVELPVTSEVVLLDIGFLDENRGFLLGTRQTLLETNDGGKTWQNREIPQALDEGINYRFNSISFNGNEGWIVGKPAILLHTTNAGKKWQRISLNAKLPGSPLVITAIGEGQAEMITDQGAIYTTKNVAQSWKAAVTETVDATLNRTVSSGIRGASYFEGYFSNVDRGINGRYVAVSSRGNFFMTWAPGDTNWMPHNRPKGRRIQNMGWSPDKTLWLASRGGEVMVGSTEGITEEFLTTKLQSRGFGLLDVGFKSEYVGYACGGSGSLFKTIDGGKTWKRDKPVDDLAGNLYSIKFISNSTGFILGNDAILLRFIGKD